MSSAVDAFPCGSRSITRTREPCWAKLAARFTAVVVLPTPPFWLAIVMIRQRGGRGHGWRSARPRTPIAASAARPIGVSTWLRGTSGTTTGAVPRGTGTPGGGAVRRLLSPVLSAVPIPDPSPFTWTPLDPRSALESQSVPGHPRPPSPAGASASATPAGPPASGPPGQPNPAVLASRPGGTHPPPPPPLPAGTHPPRP